MSGQGSSVTPPEISITARPPAPPHRFALIVEREVVDQNTAGAGRQRLDRALRAFRLRLQQADWRVCAFSSTADDAARQPLVVVLDQHTVVEPLAVIRAAAAAHRVFLEIAKRRRRLARIEHGDAVARDVHVASSLGRDAAQALEEIQRGALGSQKRTRLAGDFSDQRPRPTALAIAAMA